MAAEQVQVVDGGGNPVWPEGALYAFGNIAASTTDGTLTKSDGGTLTAVAGKRMKVYGIWFMAGIAATNVTFNSKGAGAGTAISALFAAIANGGAAPPVSPLGWFATNVGEVLTVTTGTGATVGVQVVYVLV